MPRAIDRFYNSRLFAARRVGKIGRGSGTTSHHSSLAESDSAGVRTLFSSLASNRIEVVSWD